MIAKNDLVKLRKSLSLGRATVEVKQVLQEMTVSIEQLCQMYMNTPSTVVVWQRHTVTWGLYDGGSIKWFQESAPVPNLIIEFRVFNDMEELYVAVVDNQYYGRYIQDIGAVKISIDKEDENAEEDNGPKETATLPTEKERDFIDSAAPFWGKAEMIEDDFVKLVDEGRKLFQWVPAIDRTISRKGEKYVLMTRNYISYIPRTGQASYGDYRYVAIEKEV